MEQNRRSRVFPMVKPSHPTPTAAKPGKPLIFRFLLDWNYRNLRSRGATIAGGSAGVILIGTKGAGEAA